jgi:hypothetical protein
VSRQGDLACDGGSAVSMLAANRPGCGVREPIRATPPSKNVERRHLWLEAGGLLPLAFAYLSERHNTLCSAWTLPTMVYT